MIGLGSGGVAIDPSDSSDSDEKSGISEGGGGAAMCASEGSRSRTS